jgi:tetratricopeptide (TPR) repeat protein
MLLLAVATFAVYGRIIGHDFMSNWDDNRYILENPDVLGISWDRIRAVFSHYYVGNYAPVHMLSYMLDYAVWGGWAGGFLITNLLLHTANGLIIFRLFIRLLDDRMAAWFGSALFLLHPVQVETVAWISQRKNLLAMLFFLLAWELYLDYRDSSSDRKRYYFVASLFVLILSLLSKSVAVVFPVALLLFDHCFPPGSEKIRYMDKVPYMFASAVVAMVAILSQTPDYTDWGAGGGRTGYHGGSPFATFLTMLPVFCRYILNILYPINLSAIYDPAIHKSVDLTVTVAFVLLAGIVFLVYRLYKAEPRAAFWLMFAILALVPVSQVVPLVTLMNDRYLYFPMIGVAGLCAHGLKGCGLHRFGRTTIIRGIAMVMLLGISTLSFLRSGVWCDASTLWSDAVAKSPNSWLAWEALGESKLYGKNPHPNEAIKAYLRALEINPGIEITRFNLGVAYTELNDYGNADRILKELLKLSPVNVMGWAAYGDLALRRLDYDEAERCYEKAQKLQPEAVQVRRRIGNLMIITGRFPEARSAFLRIEALQEGNDPLNAYELARVESLAGDTGAASEWLERSLQRGYRNYDGILADQELTPVRSDRRFMLLVNKYFPKGGS